MRNIDEQQMQEYLNGKKLYGDDFTIDEITQWYEDEIEGYANLGSKNRSSYSYPYHCMNQEFGFSYLPKEHIFEHALGIGSAYGDEFLPLIDRISKLTIVEPSDNLVSDKIGAVVPKYVKPQIDGTLALPDNSNDLILCLSALHHIPNVSYVLSEIIRVLSPGGYLLVREPIRSMGDWRKKRGNLTKNERGIPNKFFDNLFADKNLEVISRNYCDCAFAWIVINKLYPIKKDTPTYQKFDRYLAKALSWNIHYNSKSLLQKCAPASIYYVLRKK
jgi:SAM-dependent methyltransferase